MSLDKDKISEEPKEEKILQTPTEIKAISKESSISQIPMTYSNVQIIKTEKPKIVKMKGPNTIEEITQKTKEITYTCPTTEHITTIISKSNIINLGGPKNIGNEENIQYDTITSGEQNLVGIPFVQDKLKDIYNENSDDQENKNIIIESKHEMENNSERDNNKDNLNNIKKEVYIKRNIKGTTSTKKK